MIYDYASFTSALADFKSFVFELGTFCKGRTVKIFDTHTGVEEVDLGDIILEYNALCNHDPLFSIHRIEGVDSAHPRCIVPHRVAGMLGIYGNIVGCTVLHGLVSISIVGDDNKANTIGDDGAVKYNEEDISTAEVKECLNTIGSIAEEKFELWDKDEMQSEESLGWHYTKRPITVDHHIVVTQWMPDFPILPVILGIKDGQHTLPVQDFISRRRLAIKQTCRLFDSLFRHRQFLTPLDISTVLDLIKRVFVKMRLPCYGSFPVLRYRNAYPKEGWFPDSALCIPALCEESIFEGWFSVLRQKGYETAIVRVPVTIGADPVPVDFVAGISFKGYDSKLLGLMEQIGVVTKECLYEELLITDEVISRLDDLITRKARKVYEYTVTCDYYPWSTLYSS